MQIRIENHPLLNAYIFETIFSKKISQFEYTDEFSKLFALQTTAPVHYDVSIQNNIREMLRYGGYKPAGRGKPSSEYLRRTVLEKGLPKINPVVDLGNVVSYYSGIPLSVIDREKIEAPFEIRLGRENEKYVFNASDQEIDLKGLLCFSDTAGPCANPVKDSMRSKTNSDSYHIITILWGSISTNEYVNKLYEWYRELLLQLDNKCSIKMISMLHNKIEAKGAI